MNKVALSVVVALAASSLFAEIKMGAPFTDGAILQRQMKVPVWGRTSAPEGSRVTVAFAGQTKTADVGAGGRWRVDLDAMEASKEGRTMSVRVAKAGEGSEAAAESIAIRDVLVGEVWFASGQSNMECPIWNGDSRYRDGKGALMTTMTFLPFVRYVKCDHKWSVEPAEQTAKWHAFTPRDLQLFDRPDGGSGTIVSAVAFYYARELYLALDIPIGILDASWGGTNIDAWTPRSGYRDCDASIRDVADYPVKADWNAETDRKGPIGAAHQQPTVLYNGLVASYAPMAMRGFIWYQGCHNNGESQLYCAKLHALYTGWKADFENPALKMYLVQLAPYTQNWMGICMAQNKFVAEEGNAAIAVTSDVGNFDDVHPNDKETVAQRLVVHALKRDYGFPIREDDSPVVKGVRFADGRATVSFSHVRNWYVYAPDHSRAAAFELAGENGVWHAAKICNYRQQKNKDGASVDTDFIDGADIVLSSEHVPAPVKVRYMGRPRTAGTLYNEASLPLGPFEAPNF